jgi:peptide/nickel transport system ATP-binding protein
VAGTGHAHLRDGDNVLTIKDLVVEFKVSGGSVKAVSGISFDVQRGETLGIVGESGCGKSTTGRAIMQLPKPTSGSIDFEGRDLTTLSNSEVREARTKVQMIFQDPVSALNPRRTVRDSVLEPLGIWKRGSKAEREKLVDDILESVGIDPARAAESRPHQFSGGQCQRISVARALVLDPTLIICDEPVSALDVSVQAQVLNLLEDLKEEYGLTLVFIAHDLAVVKNISDRVAVMYLGKLCEVASSDSMYATPMHPYTNLLIASIPEPDPDADHSLGEIIGEPPSPINPPTGCRFHPRCPYATDICSVEEPQLREMLPGHFVACHNPVVA